MQQLGKRKKSCQKVNWKLCLQAGKRWTLKNSPSNEVAPIAEAPTNTEESETSEGVKSDPDSSESEGDESGDDSVASLVLPNNSDSSDSDSGNYPTTDSDSGVDEKEEIPPLLF